MKVSRNADNGSIVGFSIPIFVESSQHQTCPQRLVAATSNTSKIGSKYQINGTVGIQTCSFFSNYPLALLDSILCCLLLSHGIRQPLMKVSGGFNRIYTTSSFHLVKKIQKCIC